jgi:3-deoxy-D-manno-octulosonic-acid transferase
MLMFFYHLMWTVVLVLLVPTTPFLKKKSLRKRLTIPLPATHLGNGNIWIHALSVGEVLSAIPLVEALNRYHSDKDIVFTVTTEKGMEIAGKHLKDKVKALFSMPVDFWWSIHRITNHIKPCIFILVETDIWPGLLRYLQKKGIKSILVNGRVSPQSFKSYIKFHFFVRKMLGFLHCCLMQSDLDRKRLLRAGAEPVRVITIGNIKFDREFVPMTTEEHQKWLEVLGLDIQDPIWVAGSTHPGENELLLEVFHRLRQTFPYLRLIIAPRDISQANEIYKKARAMGLTAALRSELGNGKIRYDLLILNTIGELERIYGIGQISFVGGSLVAVGGHNLLEPANFGCPVLFGPYTENFVEMSKLLEEAGGGQRIRDKEELFEAVDRLLKNRELRIEMGKRAADFVVKNRGALKRAVFYISRHLPT